MIDVKKSLLKSGKSIVNIFPLLLGVVFLTSFLFKVTSISFYTSLLNRGEVWSIFMGNILGSISTANPTISYVIGGELLNEGVELVTVIAFLVAWGTVALAQLPVEGKALGMKFALIRNLVTFIFVFLVSVVTISLLNFW